LHLSNLRDTLEREAVAIRKFGLLPGNREKMSRSKLNTFASTIILINFANIDGMANQDRPLIEYGITRKSAFGLLVTLHGAMTACRKITGSTPTPNGLIAEALDAGSGARKIINKMHYLRLKKFMLLALSGIDACVAWLGQYLELVGRYVAMVVILGLNPSEAGSPTYNRRILWAMLACSPQMRLGYQCQLEAISDFFGRLAALLAHTTRERTEQTARWWERGAADE
jgi:hypothetical protein